MSELMRRAAPGMALAGAALVTVWLFDPALHTEVTTTAEASAADSGAAENPGAAAEETTPADAPTGDGIPTDSEDPGESGNSTDTSEPSDSGDVVDEEPTVAEEPTPAAADCSDTTAVTGDLAPTRWGPVQVRMEFAADGTVCAVQAITYPDDDRESARINALAIPYLDSQAAELGVEFDSVSGATFTSEAYRQSMQSILDQQ